MEGNKAASVPFKGVQVHINPEDAIKSLKEQTQKYPFVSFILYSERDKELAEFIKNNGDLLHDITGSDLYVGVFANPEVWDNNWWNFWKEELGAEYIYELKKRIENGQINPDSSYELAAKLGIVKGTLPVIIITTDLDNNIFMRIPIFKYGSTSDYKKFFEDIASCVQKAKVSKFDLALTAGYRLRLLNEAWYPYYSIRWKIHGGYEKLAKLILEDGPFLIQTANTIAAIIKPYVELYSSVRSKEIPAPTPK